MQRVRRWQPRVRGDARQPSLASLAAACGGLVVFPAKPLLSLIAANHVSRRRESSLSSRDVRSPGTSRESGCPVVTDGLDARRRRTTMARRRDGGVPGESLHLMGPLVGSLVIDNLSLHRH
jgi:hypothetical protein